MDDRLGAEVGHDDFRRHIQSFLYDAVGSPHSVEDHEVVAWLDKKDPTGLAEDLYLGLFEWPDPKDLGELNQLVLYEPNGFRFLFPFLAFRFAFIVVAFNVLSEVRIHAALHHTR